MASQMGRFCRQYRRIILENASKNKFLIDRPYQVEGRRLFWISSCVQTEQSHEIEQVNRPVRAVDEVSRIQPKQFEVNFQEFIRLKNYIRTRQRVAGMPFAFLGLGTSSVVSAYMFPEMFDATPENVQLIMGLDPLVFCGICGVASAGVGYALGTQLFKSLWKLMHKNQAMILTEREKDFLERIQKHRFASFSKFDDDYYGESIKNLSDYRQWLRTQQKKAEANKKFSNVTDNKVLESKKAL